MISQSLETIYWVYPCHFNSSFEEILFLVVPTDAKLIALKCKKTIVLTIYMDFMRFNRKIVDVWKMINESTITNKGIQEKSSKKLQPQLLMKELQERWSNYNWKS